MVASCPVCGKPSPKGTVHDHHQVAEAGLGPKLAACPTCSVKSTIPGEATAYKCSNCGTLVQLTGTGRAKTSTSSKIAVAALITGVVAGILSETVLHFSELWGPLPIIFGLAVMGMAYNAWIRTWGFSNMTDRK
jgi:hypothetical protein